MKGTPFFDLNRDSSWLNFWFTAVPVLIFLCAAVPNIELPGIQYDEVYYVPPAAALLKNQPDADYVMLDPSVIHVFGRPLPLMFNYYTSFLRTYLTLPFFAVFGIGVETIRGSSIALGVIALIFFIAFARRLVHDRSIAFASGVLLALDASFIAYSHNDFAVVGTMMALKGMAWWALLRWWQQPEAKFLYLGAFFIGLGITDRASFLWIPMAMAPTMALLYGKKLHAEIWQRLRSMKMLWSAVIFFALGASIFLAFNVATLGGTFAPMFGNFGKTAGGVNNFALFENFYLRLQMLSDVLSGSYLNHFVMGDLRYQTTGWHFSGSPLSWLVPLSFIYYIVRTSRCYKILSAGRGKPSRPVGTLGFLLLMIFFLLLLSCFTPTLHRGHQLLMLYPLPHIMVALFVFDLAKLIRLNWPRSNEVIERGLAPRFTGFATIFLIFLISVTAVRPVLGYHQMLKQTGGRGAWSDAIYDIVAEVDRHPERMVVCMDWGFNANILSLSKRPVQTIRNYYLHTRRSPEALTQLFDSTHVFLFHAPEYTSMTAAQEDFSAAVALAGAAVDTIRIFHQREGQPVAFLLQVRSSAETARRSIPQ